MNMNIFTAFAVLTLSAASVMTASGDTVMTLPEGVTGDLYSRNGTATRMWGTGSTKQELENGIAAEIAVSADGKTVYVRNGVGNFTSGYLVGSLEGDVVTFTLPQTIVSGESTLTVARMISNPEIDSKYLFIPDPENQTVSFTFSGDRLVPVSEDVLIGLLNSNNNWTGKILSNLSYTKVDTTEVTPPEGLEAYNFALSYALDASTHAPYPQYRLLYGCNDDSYIYIRGIDTSLPDKWFRIALDGKDATVNGGQFLGVSNERVLYLCAVLDTPEWNPGYQVWEHSYELVDSFGMDYDRKAGKLTPKNSKNALCVNSGDGIYNYGTVYLNSTLTSQPLEISLKPRAPFMDEDIHFFTNGAEPELIFQTLPLNEKGQLLDTANFGYEVFCKDKPYVFDGFDYWLNDDEDVTFIPWLFQSPYIYSSDNGTQYIFFQEPFVHDLTIRSVYRDSDGTEYFSEPLDPLNPESSVSMVGADRTEISEIRLDINGRVVSSDAKGIVVKCTVYSDGSREYRKIIRK